MQLSDSALQILALVPIQVPVIVLVVIQVPLNFPNGFRELTHGLAANRAVALAVFQAIL
jgi:hypothetical protein